MAMIIISYTIGVKRVLNVVLLALNDQRISNLRHQVLIHTTYSKILILCPEFATSPNLPISTSILLSINGTICQNLISIKSNSSCIHYVCGLTILNFEAENAGDIIRRIFLHASPLAVASPSTLYSSGTIGTLHCKDKFMLIMLHAHGNDTRNRLCSIHHLRGCLCFIL